MMIPSAITLPTIPPTIAPTGGDEDTGSARAAPGDGLSRDVVVCHIVVTAVTSTAAPVTGTILVPVTVVVTVLFQSVDPACRFITGASWGVFVCVGIVAASSVTVDHVVIVLQ
jgi:hypothetical protein